jgi:hypothetical protein
LSTAPLLLLLCKTPLRPRDHAADLTPIRPGSTIALSLCRSKAWTVSGGVAAFVAGRFLRRKKRKQTKEKQNEMSASNSRTTDEAAIR